LNWLESNPTYPKNPKTFGDYMRKWRMEKGILIREFAQQLEVTEDTVINWEKRGRRPTTKHIRKVVALVPDVAGLSRSLPFGRYTKVE